MRHIPAAREDEREAARVFYVAAPRVVKGQWTRSLFFANAICVH